MAISGHQRSSVIISGHQWPSQTHSPARWSGVRTDPCGVTRCTAPWPRPTQASSRSSPARWSSAVISGHQRSTAVISGHQRSSAVNSGHQWSSVVISGHQWPAREAHLPSEAITCSEPQSRAMSGPQSHAMSGPQSHAISSPARRCRCSSGWRPHPPCPWDQTDARQQEGCT